MTLRLAVVMNGGGNGGQRTTALVQYFLCLHMPSAHEGEPLHTYPDLYKQTTHSPGGRRMSIGLSFHKPTQTNALDF